MKIKAYPKINLCLKVYKGMTEGKHKIDSVMYLYKKIYDTIHIKKYDCLYITYKDHGKEILISDCLVERTLKYLHNKYNININYRIIIKKRIPFSAGLGGGSADAAAILNYVLSKNPRIHLDLKEIASNLGSDIPFFLSNYKIARVQGLGEYVAPIYDWQPKIELKFNDIVCSTEKVFKALEKDENYSSRVNVEKIITNHLYKQHLTNVVYNDLTKYIIQNYKELQDVYAKYTGASFFTGAGGTIVTIKE